MHDELYVLEATYGMPLGSMIVKSRELRLL